MKKSIPKVRERESEASILGNDREREFPLTPAIMAVYYGIVDRDHRHPMTSLRRSLKFSYLIRLNFSENF